MHLKFSFAAQAVRLSSTRKKPTCDANPVTARPNFAAPELLSPAGDIDCACAAVENGADAVYFGLRVGLNARSKAKNFALEELPEFMDYLHLRGVQGFVTLNTLVFPSELDLLEKSVRAVVSAGVDAAIVQDVGAARLIRAIAPDFTLHASTQMSITSAEGVEMAARLGISRVVLAREFPSTTSAASALRRRMTEIGTVSSTERSA